jgi:hypothetical protein
MKKLGMIGILALVTSLVAGSPLPTQQALLHAFERVVIQKAVESVLSRGENHQELPINKLPDVLKDKRSKFRRYLTPSLTKMALKGAGRVLIATPFLYAAVGLALGMSQTEKCWPYTKKLIRGYRTGKSQLYKLWWNRAAALRETGKVINRIVLDEGTTLQDVTGFYQPGEAPAAGVRIEFGQDEYIDSMRKLLVEKLPEAPANKAGYLAIEPFYENKVTGRDLLLEAPDWYYKMYDKPLPDKETMVKVTASQQADYFAIFPILRRMAKKNEDYIPSINFYKQVETRIPACRQANGTFYDRLSDEYQKSQTGELIPKLDDAGHIKTAELPRDVFLRIAEFLLPPVVDPFLVRIKCPTELGMQSKVLRQAGFFGSTTRIKLENLNKVLIGSQLNLWCDAARQLANGEKIAIPTWYITGLR